MVHEQPLCSLILHCDDITDFIWLFWNQGKLVVGYITSIDQKYKQRVINEYSCLFGVGGPVNCFLWFSVLFFFVRAWQCQVQCRVSAATLVHLPKILSHVFFCFVFFLLSRLPKISSPSSFHMLAFLCIFSYNYQLTQSAAQAKSFCRFLFLNQNLLENTVTWGLHMCQLKSLYKKWRQDGDR